MLLGQAIDLMTRCVLLQIELFFFCVKMCNCFVRQSDQTKLSLEDIELEFAEKLSEIFSD